MAADQLAALTALTILTQIGGTSLDYSPFLQVLHDNHCIVRRKISRGVQHDNIEKGIEPTFTDSSGNNMVQFTNGFYYSQASYKTLAASRLLTKDILSIAREKSGVFDPVRALIGNSLQILYNKLYSALLSDGTGNAGADLEGLTAAVVKDPTTTIYQGVDPKLYPDWVNKSYDTAAVVTGSDTFDGSAMTVDNIIDRILWVIADGQSNGGNIYSHLMLGRTWFQMLRKALQKKGTVTVDKSTNNPNVRIGLRSIEIDDVVIMNGGGWNASGFSGISPKSAIFFTPHIDNMELFYHNPQAEDNKIQKLKNTDKLYEAFKNVRTEEDITSLFYIDLVEYADGVGFMKKEGTFDQTLQFGFHGNFMMKRRELTALMWEK